MHTPHTAGHGDPRTDAIALSSPPTGRLARLVELGQVEIILAAGLAVFAVAVHLTLIGQWQPLLLDVCACAAAAASGRRPRTAGIALAVILAVYLFVPPPWQTLGEYASFIPILGAGMRNDRRWRLALSLILLPLVAGITWRDAPRPASAVLGSLFWVVAFAVMWIIGTVFARTVAAQQEAHVAILLRQRQAVARELHDTIAASLTRLAMAAERGILHETISGTDLRIIADSASASIHDLRWIVGLLRDPSEVDQLRLERPTAVGAALRSAEKELADHGFEVTVAVTGELSIIPDTTARILSAATREATNNIIKHGDTDGATAILVEIGPTEAELVFINRRRSTRLDNSAPPTYGLTGLRERLAEVGGEVFLEGNAEQWVTRLVVPLEGLDERRDTDT